MPMVVAEWGQTNQGSVIHACAQARAAKDAGCWGAKWQLLQAGRLAAADAPAYWAHARPGEQQAETFTRNGMIDYGAWGEVAAECDGLGLAFSATPFDLEAVAALDKLDRVTLKVASGDITYRDLLRAVGDTGRPVVLSCGASDRDEIEQALSWLGHDEVTLLACALVYPCPPQHANLARITTLDCEFGLPVGYSDHTTSVFTGYAAAALGATMLEKHTTLTPAGACPDDHMGLTPDLLGRYVGEAGNGAALRGAPHLVPAFAEAPARFGARRSWHAACDLTGGGELRPALHLQALRPCPAGAVPVSADVDGMRLLADVKAGQRLTYADIGWAAPDALGGP